MIERFGSLLAGITPVEQPPTPREVAELIWLARNLPEETGQDGPVTLPPEGRATPSPTGSAPVSEPSEASAADRGDAEATRLYLPWPGCPNEGAETQAEQAAPVRVGGSAALPRRRELARALRPLKRRVPSTVNTVLDEDATASRIADHHHWIPVFTPAEDRWLDLLIVLDAYSESGIFWEPLARELRTLCQQLGAFRDVRLCRLLARSDGSPGLGAGAVTPPHRLRSTSSAVDSTGRTVTLLLTDGVAPAWRSEVLRGVLRKWAASGPTAILQALPEHAWERTALAPEPVRLRSTEAGGTNSTLLYTGYGLRPDGPKRGALPVPVLGVSPEWLAPWAHAIAEPAAFDAAAVLLPASAARSRPHSGVLDMSEVPGQGVTFEDFRAQAQPGVLRLAAYLAAAPLNLAVMRTVQSAMLPDSPLSDLAEIVYSGLLRRVRGGNRTDDALGQVYEFVPGVRERLLSGLRRDEADEVIATVSAYVDRNAPTVSARFTATVPDPDGTLTLPAGARHWAEVHNLVRRRQGRRPASATLREQATPDVATKPTPEPAEPATRSTVLVLTALGLEYNAIRAHVEERRKFVHPRNGTLVEMGQLPGTSWHVAIAELGMGAAQSAALTTALIDWLQPEAVFFIGVAGSLKDDVGIGDVVVGTRVYEIHGGKQTPEGLLVRPRALPTSLALQQAARSAVRDVPDVRVHFMPIATGDVVLAEAGSEIAQLLRRSYDDVGAIEMGGSGAAHVAHLNGQLDTLVIRGISDRADGGKSGAHAPGAQQLAVSHAAAVTAAVLRKHQPRKGSSLSSDSEQGSHRLGDDGATYDGDHIDFRDGTFHGPVIGKATGRSSGESTAHGPVPRAATTLPPRPPGFTGRSAELDRLLPQLSPDEDALAALPAHILAVTGMGGIGKTALAVEAAHRARARGWFPGGTLLVDLRGSDEDPVKADQAVVALLGALGVRDRDLPPTTERRYDAYRALLADRRDRMLLILDNALDPTECLPLLPGTDRHRVLITSRDRRDRLPIRLIHLETLAPDDSVALVTRALHDTDERDDRPARELDALRELTDLCGHLPLVLLIAAGMLHRRRYRAIASLVAEIRDAGAAAGADSAGPGTDPYGSSLTVRPVLETSYRQLPPDQARLLRLLCLAPGPETGTEALAALTDTDAVTVLSRLEELAARYLVTPVRDVDGTASATRWRVHDVVRAFGAGVVTGAQSRPAGSAHAGGRDNSDTSLPSPPPVRTTVSDHVPRTDLFWELAGLIARVPGLDRRLPLRRAAEAFAERFGPLDVDHSGMTREDLYATLRECDAYPDGLRFYLDTLGSGRAGTLAWQAVEQVYLRLYPAEPEETPGPEATQDELSNLVTRARVVLFDFDGPICRLFASHSAERIAGELVDWLEGRGLRGLLTEEESITPDPHVVMRAVGRRHPGSDLVAELEERLTAEELRAVTSAMPTPFADPLIRSWTAMGVRLAITTNNSPRAVMTYLRSRGLHDAFTPHIYGRTTDLAHLKPAPSVLNRALRAMGVEPEDALSIGDSPSDLEASRRADVPFLGYARNERKEELLRTAGAQVIVHSLESVLRVIMSASAS